MRSIILINGFIIFNLFFVNAESITNGYLEINFVHTDSFIVAGKDGVEREHDLTLPQYKSNNSNLVRVLTRITDSIWTSYLGEIILMDSTITTSLYLSFNAVLFTKNNLHFKIAGIYNWTGMPHDEQFNDTVKIRLTQDCAFVLINEEQTMALEQYHEIALKHFKMGKISDAIKILRDKMVDPWHIRTDHINILNDYGYFLEQGKEYNEAIKILNIVLHHAPNRTVAYINLGDAYYELHQIDKAREAYLKYIALMKKEGKQAKIPKRVWERVKKNRK